MKMRNHLAIVLLASAVGACATPQVDQPARGVMTVPLILFILPTLFIVILGPAACSINDSFING